MPLASAQTCSGRHVIQVCCHLPSNDDGNKDRTAKTKSHGGARQGSEGQKAQ